VKKSSTAYVCQECGYESPEWLGKCPECGMWNSLREFKIPASAKTSAGKQISSVSQKPRKLGEIGSHSVNRLSTGFSEMDGVLGGGIVAGSVILLAGDPGVGKSTLLLQIALNLSLSKVRSSLNSSVLYISGEESGEQIKLRTSRIYKNHKDIENVYILSATNTDLVQEAIEEYKPGLVIVDSIQTMESENAGGLSGSISQIRYCASLFIKIAKTQNIPIIIVGHVTKEGMVAGPMVLSHMVDTILFLEGEKSSSIRILRSFKNRFGPVDEVGIFSMEAGGIVQSNSIEQLFLTKNLPKNVTGSIISVAMEGSRAFLVEIQGLVVSSKIPIPRRVSSGIDYKRLELILAVLQKHCNIPLSGMDVFVNVAGGLKISDTAVDLGICLAIFSSFKNISLSTTVAVSEVGLLGELRPVQFLDRRIKEAKKLGFKNVISHNTYRTLSEVIRSLGKGGNYG